MLDTFGRIANRLADYTIGTVIVLVHVTLADRRGRLQLAAPEPASHERSWSPGRRRSETAVRA
jgi:hypothetical protein